MARDVEHYHRRFLDVLAAHGRGGGQGLPEQRAPVGLSAAGHQAVRALVEEVHDQGYVLGQLHADGIFPEGGEADAAALEERLGIDELKARGRYRQGRTDAPPPPGETVYGIRPHLPRTPEREQAERELAERYVRDHSVGNPHPELWDEGVHGG